MIKLFSTTFLLLFLYSCSVIPLGIDPASQQLTDRQGTNKSYQIIGTVEDGDGYLNLFGIIPLGEININDTFKEIAKKRGGDALINIRYWYRSSYYFIGTYNSLEVKADVIKFIQ
jgi:hypothetical protein